jgi:hypothetical protein
LAVHRCTLSAFSDLLRCCFANRRLRRFERSTIHAAAVLVTDFAVVPYINFTAVAFIDFNAVAVADLTRARESATRRLDLHAGHRRQLRRRRRSTF